jgi:hypothetical protein
MVFYFLFFIDCDISAGLISGFGIGVSGSFCIILSLALKYDGMSPLPLRGSTVEETYHHIRAYLFYC